jgi:hypothetical protein
MISPRSLENDPSDIESSEPLDEGAMALRAVGDAEALAGGMNRASFEMSTPTLCVMVDLIFSQSSSCLRGMPPGCPFRPLGKERGGQTTTQSFRIGAVTTHPLSPPACVGDRPAATNPAGSDGKSIRQDAVVDRVAALQRAFLKNALLTTGRRAFGRTPV